MTNGTIDATLAGWGLIGGFAHCIGMCGIFVLSCAGPPSPDRAGFGAVRLERHAAFHGARLCLLALLGAIAGTLGSLTHLWAQAQSWLALGAGVAMLCLALGYAGIVPWLRIPEPDVLGAGGGAGRRLFVRALQSRSALRPLAIGAFVGLLPCGLTYNALIPAAATQSALAGATAMACFGAGTIPGLLALGMAGGTASGFVRGVKFRTAMTRAGAVVMAVLGIAFIGRALPGLH